MEIIDNIKPAVPDIYVREQNLRKFFLSVLRNDRVGAEEISSESYRKSVLSPAIEGSNSAGGYLVPEEFSSMVATDLRNDSVALRECQVIPMQREALNISTLVGIPSVAWVDENSSIPASIGTIGRLTLTAKKLAAIMPASEELFADNNVQFSNLMSASISSVFVTEIDTQIFQGSGSPFTGILNAGGVNTVYLGGTSSSGKTKYTDITWDDVFTLITTSLATRNMVGAKLYIDQNVANVLVKKKASGSGEYFIPLLQGPAMNPTDSSFTLGYFFGVPIVVLTSGILIRTFDGDAHVSTPFCAFGNLKRSCYIGDRLELQVDISKDATVETINAFANDLLMWRFKKRLGFGISIPAKLAVLSTAAS